MNCWLPFVKCRYHNHRTKADMNVLLFHCLQANRSCSPFPRIMIHSPLIVRYVNLLTTKINDDQSMKIAFDVDQFVKLIILLYVQWHLSYGNMFVSLVNEHRDCIMLL